MFLAEFRPSTAGGRRASTRQISAGVTETPFTARRLHFSFQIENLPPRSVTGGLPVNSGVSAAASPITDANPQLINEHVNYAGTGGARDIKPLSDRALVADYQSTLRYYRELKQQIGDWQAAFFAQHGRPPTPNDARLQGGPQLAARYTALLEVRSRLMVELPRLRPRLQDPSAAAAEGGQGLLLHAPARPQPGGSRGASPADQPPHRHHQPHQQHQQQRVDSVATWLRADRYRRRLATTAAEPAANGATAASDASVAPVAMLDSAIQLHIADSAVAPQQQQQQTHAEGLQQADDDISLSYTQQGDVLHCCPPAVQQLVSPGEVLQPLPLEQWRGAGAGDRTGGGLGYGEGGSGGSGGSGGGGTAAAAAGLLGAAAGVEAQAGGGAHALSAAAPSPAPPEASLGGQPQPHQPHPHQQQLTMHSPHPTSQQQPATQAATATPSPNPPPSSPSASSSSSSSLGRLHADVALAGDSRTRGALMAALAYRQARGAAAGAAAGDGAEEGRGAEVDSAGGVRRGSG
ncbi:hypothetical protein Agub_g7216, partial [Astrephomene gubernaculifera]